MGLADGDYEMSFIGCPVCTETIPVVFGIRVPVENHCGCCWASFKLMQRPDGFEASGPDVDASEWDEMDDPWPT